ncbi:MAG TPA: Uma2 family endonuclease [Pyrinomonadaceae bacterium]|nr:Uma2 family endonuclease [Pyrinomonadaceae bacterium]
MGIPKLKLKISVEDYLEGEKVSQIKHEYIDGEVYAMAGTSKSHNRIIGNLIEKLKGQLRGSDCEPFFVDIKVRVEKMNRFYYPDIVVVCGEDDEDDYYAVKPKLIVEVLSPRTSLTDRREKMFAYKEIESLEEYVLIEQERMYAEIYRRREGDGGLWDWIEYEADEEIDFASVDFKMPMAEIYAGVQMPELKDWERRNL